jgi:uncharacterized membrane protein YgcG
VDIVLGVSLTPKTVHMVLVEGAKADGAIVDHDAFDLWSGEGTANQTAADQLVAAVLGTQESATEGGHVLTSIGVTWTDRVTAASLRDALAARGISDVLLVSELHAAGALAQAAGQAVGYESTGLLFVDRDTATLSVVRSDDGSIVKVLSRSLHATDAMAVLAEMVAAVDAQDSPPQGMFIVGSGVDIDSVKEHLADLVSIPVNAPEEPALALARGAALAAANAPPYDATTAGLGGLAYSQDPDGATAGSEVGLANASNAATQMRPVSSPLYSDALDADDFDVDDAPVDERRKPFLLVGSALTAIFVIGVVGLVISLAVSIRPTADQRPDAGQAAIVPSVAPLAPPTQEQLPTVLLPAPPPPPPETIQPPVPVVQQAPAPRRVVVAPAAPAPAVAPAPPAAPPPLPEAPPVLPPPVYIPPPVYNPPPVYIPPRAFLPPIFRPPRRPDPPSYPQYPPQGPQYPPQYPPQGPQYPDYPPPRPPRAPQYPDYPPPPPPQLPPTQAPQYPYQQSDYGDGPSGGGGYGQHDSGGSGGGGSYGSGGGGGGGGCVLLLCLGGGHH